MKRILVFLMTLSIMLPSFPAISFAEDFEGVTFYSNTDKTQLESLDDVSEVYAEVSFEATADSATVVVAHYDYSGLLTKTEFINQIDTEDGQNITYTTPSFSVADSDIVKVFAWDGINSMKPLLKTPGVIAKSVPLPTATATTLDTASISVPLTFAMNFKADPATEEQLAYYGSWYADFVLTVNKDITYNADGSADGYLAGQYDSWSENWLAVPNKTYEVKADTPVKIMESAAAIYGKKGLKYTYREVYEKVKDFDCGVFFNEKFLTENPDLKATLELRIYNPKNADESYRIGENYEFTLPNAPAGETVLTAGKVTAVVPSGVILENGTDGLKLTTKSIDDSQSGISADENEKLTSYDIHIDGVSKNNTTPIIITFPQAADKGLNKGNLSLYHVENGKTVAMEEVNSTEDLTKHNQFNYEPLDGTVTLALATFSEIALVADTTAKWEGKYDYSWYDSEKTELKIANADQLAAFGAIVGGMNGQTKDSFAGKTVKLVTDINLGDKDNENESLIFHPIGYYYTDDKNADGTTGDYYSTVKSFEGTFDGNGNTISNFYQNTWEIKGDYDANYYSDAMGLFGYVVNGTVKNLTVNNFSSDGEFTPTGVIAAYAVNSTFENIAITDCNPRVYNTGNGGIVGIGGNSDDDDSKKLIFKNITVDNSNKISALWGSWDVACGGLMGMFRGNGLVDFTNCHVSAQIDVYNDVCANYQYYAYRYAGMMIGSIRKNETIDGHVYPNMKGITATDCTVHFGDWNDYYYCELVANSLASYTHDHQFSRLTQVDSVDTENKTVTVGEKTTAIPTSGRVNYVVVKGTHATENATCYHFVDGKVWNHEDAGKETVNGVEVLKEDNQHIYLEFNQLFTGYGWGVTSKGINDFVGIETDIKITEGEHEESVKKFNAIVKDGASYETGTTVAIVNLFEYIEDSGVELKGTNVQVTVSPADENSTVTGTYVENTTDWTKGELTFSGKGKATVTITDYYFCIPTTIEVEITEKTEEEKFEKKFTGDFLYRVGNNGRDNKTEYDVTLGDLFEARNGATIGTVSVTVETVGGTGATGTPNSATYSKDSWATGTIDFNGTGVVKVTIKDDNFCIPTELYLEVVDATNITSATGTTTGGNLVLLNNVNATDYVNYWNCTLYGNGFTYSLKGAPTDYNSKQGHGIIIAQNSTIDNVVFIGDIYGKYGAYKDQPYYNSVIDATESTIQNCHISNCSAPVRARGNITIKDTTLYGGTVANLIIMSGIVTVDNLTTVNYNDDNVTGLGIVIHSDATDTTKLVIKSKLKQYNFIEEGKSPEDSNAKTIYENVFSTSFTDYHFVKSGKLFANTGIISLTDKFGIDDIEDLANTGYVDKNVRLKIVVENIEVEKDGFVYSQPNTLGTVDNNYIENSDPNKSTVQGDFMPTFTFDLGDQAINGEDRYIKGDKDGVEIRYLSDQDPLDLDISKVATVTKYGIGYPVTAICKDSTGNVVAKNTDFKFNKKGSYTLEFTVDDNLFYDDNGELITKSVKRTYAVPLNVVVAEPAIKDAVITVNKTALDGGYNESSGDRSYKFNPLNAIAITDAEGAVNLTTNIASTNIAYASSSSAFAGATTITVTYNDGRVLEIKLGKPSLNSPGSSKAIIYENDGTIKSAAKVASKSAKGGTWTVTSYSFKGTNGKTVTNNTVVTFTFPDKSCVTGDTLVTLADGSQKRIDEVTYSDVLLVWDFFEGKYAQVPSAIIFYHGDDDYRVLTLKFADGTKVKVINNHGFFDVAKNEFVFIDESNVGEYIGHKFVKQDGNTYTTVELTGFEVTNEYTGCYSIQSAKHINFITEGLFSLTIPPYEGWFDYFEIGDNMKYDEAKMQADIQKYGLYTYEDFDEYVTYEQFIAFNGPYVKVLVGRGVLTFNQILELISSYVTPTE